MTIFEFPIISKLGGREAVIAELQSRGLVITKDAIRMWIARRSIPGAAQRLLMQIADDRHLRYGSRDFDVTKIISRRSSTETSRGDAA